MYEMLNGAKQAAFSLACLNNETRTCALRNMAQALFDSEEDILAANRLDMENAKGHISTVMLDRLALNHDRIASMAKGILSVAALPDPLNTELDRYVRPDGLQIRKVSVPIGVVAIIYESRPNVTADAAALCIKSGNVCVLRSGKEAFRSANAIVDALKKGLRMSGISEHAVNLVQDTSRESAKQLMTANGFIDLLIPRGGAGLIQACVTQATVPCIATGTGICHIYVEETADQEMALSVIENAKTSRPSVCNAAEVLLVDKAIAPEFLPKLKARLDQRQVELRLDDFACTIIDGIPAGEQDFDTEFLDYILAIRCVDGTMDAISHIAAHSTGHSEAILSQNDAAIDAFARLVDSAAVYINASTRFTDGGEFGLGCEMGISTQKLHARGPMGLRELTTYKYIITGKGHIR